MSIPFLGDMELKQGDQVTVVLSAYTLKAGLWGMFGVMFLTFGLNSLTDISNYPVSLGVGAVQVVGAVVFLVFLFGRHLGDLLDLAREAEEEWGPITTRNGKEIRGGGVP